MLTEPEREHIYMLSLGRLPEARYQPVDGISPRLQRLLDVMVLSPAITRTAMWDVVGGNRAAALLLTDYAKLPREGRNILRLTFGSDHVRVRNEDSVSTGHPRLTECTRAPVTGQIVAARKDRPGRARDFL